MVDGTNGRIPSPDIAGGLVVKSRAAVIDRRLGPERHLRDLAFLYSLVRDPIGLRETLGAQNRARLRRVGPLGDPDHFAWRELGRVRAAEAIAAHAILTQTDG